ncbi:FAD-dependent monooxygenase [Streptomyces lydicus]|uniref:FAD-dependent monooxygenase n=1 Tax=Streptomyces lydicus TaxID=47763 RepID=UPI00099FF3D4|nr:FAD-dependent monooxygenase [Streptomyces lydicus]
MDPVIVVGAGPVGLSLALALARLGVPSVVLDETPGQEETRPARTAVLRPDTAAFVGRLGCADALESAGTRWAAWRIMRRRRLVERVAFAPRTPDDVAGPAPASPVHLPQHALTRALRAALAREKLAEVVTGSRLSDLEQDEHGISAHTRGPNGTWWRGSYLIGCDGPRSTVRKLLDIRFPGRTAVERHAVAALRCELPWPGEALLHRSPPRQGGGPGSEVSARPLADGVWRLDWLLPPGRELVTPDALVARIRDSLAGWSGEAPAEPGTGPGPDGDGNRRHGPGRLVPPYELLDTGVHTVHHRLARRWRQGRAFLAGDAAHLLGALGTQGLDEGLRDAENLAWKLGLAWHHGASELLLDSYQAERRGAVAARLRAADQALPLLRDGRSVRWRTVLPGAARGRSTLLTDGHLGRGPLGAPPVYARTPLAPPAGPADGPLVETVPGAPVVDVAVTASDGSVVRLHDRLGQGLLVILVAPGTTVWDRRHWQSAGLMPRLTSAVAALPMSAELLVTESYPGAAAHTVLLVRPDGHLVTALAGVRPEEMTACAEAVRGGTHGRGAGAARRAGSEGAPVPPAGGPAGRSTSGASGAAPEAGAPEASEASGGPGRGGSGEGTPGSHGATDGGGATGAGGAAGAIGAAEGRDGGAEGGGTEGSAGAAGAPSPVDPVGTSMLHSESD